ncbi:hypothetical protein BO71DRAFT_336083 [Aspergillus ellipticus CBS 707.79]|uniref:Uncharacterized protein n=1 Tax=Aspergillus ellipticus CBS 707.79 TaxID=1448320 RepID=A0A319EF94_9EURO|nr:hypothetical protein BO71DRAFT_336083 [Aspergillus ellipticus CBS 707.79]
MKPLNLLTLSILTTFANAAAIPDDTSLIPKTILETRYDICGQFCTGKNSCWGKCPKCGIHNICVKK